MLYLASKSPRRRQLLEQIGIRFDVLDVDVPEIRRIDEPAEDYVSRVAREKAGAGLLQVAAVAGACVLGADTEVILDGEVFGKPADAGDASVSGHQGAAGKTRIHDHVGLEIAVELAAAAGAPGAPQRAHDAHLDVTPGILERIDAALRRLTPKVGAWGTTSTLTTDTAPPAAPATTIEPPGMGL